MYFIDLCERIAKHICYSITFRPLTTNVFRNCSAILPFLHSDRTCYLCIHKQYIYLLYIIYILICTYVHYVLLLAHCIYTTSPQRATVTPKLPRSVCMCVYIICYATATLMSTLALCIVPQEINISI